MPRAPANGLELEYDTFGEGPTIVLIMGIGSQMILWDTELCERIASQGYRVVRFDNRDIGLSTWLDHLGKPNLPSLAGRAALGMRVPAPYTLADMAADVVGLLDHLGVDQAHIVGASMGGMIAQHMAIDAPERVRSLTLIMSTAGNIRHLLGVQPAAVRGFLGKRPNGKEETVEYMVELFRLLHGGQTEFPEARTRARGLEAAERSWHPQGFPRHLAAILASGDRSAALKKLRVPTLVLHGEADPLVPISAGRAMAEIIPGARFEAIPKMGHFLPPEVWPSLASNIASHAASAEGA